MIIKSLELCNFRQFYDVAKIDFCIGENSNVSIILGDNTTGKTTLLQSFLWCLYGHVDLPKKDKLLNFDREVDVKNKEVEVWVKLVIQSKGTEYIITRKNIYTTSSLNPSGILLSVSFKNSKGVKDDLKGTKAQNLVEKIFPPGLSSCFFFDNERISNITHKKNIASSVESLLGLNVISNAINHLGPTKDASLKRFKTDTVIGLLERKCIDLEDYDSNTLINEIEKIEQQIEVDSRTIEEVITNNKRISDIIEQHKDNIEQNQTIIKEREERNVLQDKLLQSINNISKYQNIFTEFFSNEYYKLLLNTFNDEIKIIKTVLQDEDDICYMPEVILKSILEKKQCICGNPIERDSKEYNQLIELSKKLEKNKEKKDIHVYIEQISNNEKKVSNVKNKLEELYGLISNERNLKLKFEQQIDDITEHLKGKDDVRYLLEEILRNERILQTNVNKVEVLEEKIKKLEENLKVKKKEYNMLIEANRNNEGYFKQIKYAKSIRNQYEDYFENQKNEIKLLLEKNVSSIFNEMFSGHRKVIINSNYSLDLLLYSENNGYRESIESPGLTTVKNFAFITGLVETARVKMLQESASNFNVEPEQFPLVMDAPFSNADEHHVERISKMLPKIAEQIIFFTMKKDWDIAKNVIPTPGKIYKIIKKSESKSTIEEVSYV